MTYKEIIACLSSLDLSTYPSEKVEELIGRLGKFGIIQMTLHKGKVILRSRPMNFGQRFSTRSELSYVPAINNKSYQRASTPNQTMFYGAVIPEGISIGELDNARIIAALETSYLLRNIGQDGEQPVTFSKWEVSCDIPLVAICYHKDFLTKSSHTKELYDSFQNSIADLPKELRERTFEITEFFAGQFAKKPMEHDYDYMISAIFSEVCTRKGMAGVYYPSIRADAKGYNIAILPHFADHCLRLVAAGECTIYKRGEETIVDNDTICTITDDTQPLIYSLVEKEFHIGREQIMQEFAKKVTT